MLPVPWPVMCVLNVWNTAGARGVPIFPSTGLGRIRTIVGLNEDIPLIPSLIVFFQQEENLHCTLIAIVPERLTVDGIIQATKSVVGDLNQPNTGVLVILPVLEAYGMTTFNKKENG